MEGLTQESISCPYISISIEMEGKIWFDIDINILIRYQHYLTLHLKCFQLLLFKYTFKVLCINLLNIIQLNKSTFQSEENDKKYLLNQSINKKGCGYFKCWSMLYIDDTFRF